MQRIVERIVERALPTYTIAQGGITEAILNDHLNQLDNKLSSQISSLSASLTSIPYSLPASGGITNTIALSQHIDNLDGTHIARAVITDATISGGNVTATAFSGLLGVGSGGTGTSTAPSYGNMLVGNSAGGYDLLATSSLGISAGGIPGGSDRYVQFNNGDVFGGVSSFTFASSTGLLTVPFASTTALTISGTASTSLFFANGLSNCSSNNNLTWLAGTFGCEPDDTSTGAANPFAWEQNYATVNAATSSVFWAKNGLNASSTSHFANASTTLLTIGTQWFTSLANSGLGVDANGKVYPAATSTLANIGGVLALTSLANQSANTVLANATGGSAAPTAISTTSLFAGVNGQVLAFSNGTWTGVATTTFSTGLTYAGGAVTCDTASGSILGCLSSADWNTFNNKQAALTFAYPLQNNTNTISLAFGTTTQNFWNSYNNFSSLFATNASTTNATTTNLHIAGLTNSGLGVDANGKVYAAATSTLSSISGQLNLGTQVTGSLALSSIAQIGANSVLVNNTSALGNVTSIATSSFFGTGVGGTVLSWSGGVPAWVATTTLTNGTGITTTYSAATNQWTITNTGATFAFPFTTIDTFGTTSAATSSSIHTTGVFFASSTAAASVFPFASSTALSAGTLCLSTDCRTSWPAGGGSGDPFTHETWWGQSGVSATTSALHLTGSPFSLFASSTAVFDLASSTAASTTRLTVGAQWFTSLANSGLGVDANGRVYAAATSTLANISGTLALTQLENQAANTVLANLTGGSAAPTAISTTTLFTGSNGQVLAFLNGAWSGTATTTNSCSSGINCTFDGNIWSFTNTYGYPFTAASTFATTTAATTTSIWTQGAFYASSTVASQFPYASSTAFTASGSGYFAADAGASVGVGTTSPWGLLSINPNGITGPAFVIGSSTATNFIVTNGGNVGIGSTSPNYTLDVNGDVNVASGKCFRVNGVCIGYVTKLVAIYATSTPGTNVAVVFSGGASPSYLSGTLTLPASTTHMVVEMWGGGGGGGGDSSSGDVTGGGGGGSGAYGMKLFTSIAPNYYYNIGGGGNGGARGVNGSAGSASSFGTGSATTTFNGGSGGSAATDSGVAIPGVGGAGGTDPATADVHFGGRDGDAGSMGESGVSYGSGGSGGSAPRGGSGGGGGSQTSGRSGQAPGGGGGGGGGTGGGGSGASGGLAITVYATSSPTSAGNDYAEMFPVSNPGITAGDIVAVDAGVPVSMKLASAGESAPLAGVIATNPGQVLGDINATGERPVALSGRVPAKVNLEGGSISIGDRIAPSSVPGVGKKAGPFDDSVGIALDSFSGSADASSQGSVTVFIDLQHGIDVNAIALKLLGWDNLAVAAGFASATSSESSGQSSPLDFVGGVMRDIATRIDSLASTELTYSADATSTGMTSNDASSSPASSTPADTFASGLLRSIFAQIARWLSNAANGIESIFAKVGNFGKVNTDELCVGGTCVSSLQFQAMAAAAGQSHAAANTSGSEEPPPMSSSPADATNTPPVIRINGNNPAHINIGDAYADLGATITGPEADLNLGIKTFLNGALVSDIVLDTSRAATDTIDYVVTDQNGLTSTSTRTVIVEAAAAAEPPPSTEETLPPTEPTPPAPDTTATTTTTSTTATTTEATSTAQ